MKKSSFSLLAVAIGALLAPQHALAYGEFNARLDCLDKVTGWGSGYSNPSDIRVNETGHNSYVVTGKVFFENDRRRKIDYRCSFDRAGNIYDGHYEYRYEDDR